MVAEVLRRCVPPLWVHTDHAGILRGIARGRAWCTAGDRLWAGYWVIVWNVLDDVGLGEAGIQILKVPAHVTMRMVGEGRATLWQQLGNDAADARAVQGAGVHRVPRRWVFALRAIDERVAAVGQWVGQCAALLKGTGSVHADVTRLPRTSRGPKVRAVLGLRLPEDGGHFWRRHHDGGWWYCLRCGARSVKRKWRERE